MNSIKLTIAQDTDCENPLSQEWSDGAWTHVDFRRHYGDDPRTIDDFCDQDSAGRYYPKIGFRAKLRAGSAFLLDRYTHSGDHWYFHSNHDLAFDPGGWDTSRFAGILIFDHPITDMGAKDYEGRKRDAKSALDEFNSWLEGDCYGFIMEGLDFAFEDSCWGFIGRDYACQSIKECLPDVRPLRIVYSGGETGQIAWGDHKWGEGIEVIDSMKEYREIVREEDEAEAGECYDYDRLEVA